MPQDSIYYALGRISVLSGDALTRQKLERLLQAQSADEAKRVLSEIGWADAEDAEKAASEHVAKACKVVRELATSENTLDCFLTRYDVNNLKILLKARSLNQTTDALSPCGVIPTDTLRHAVSERDYHALPAPIKEAADALEKQMAVSVDPLLIDVRLDQAMYAYIMERLPKNDKVARAYFTAQIDLTNLVMALRLKNMQKPVAFFEDMLIPGGSVDKRALLKAYERPERLPLLVKKYGSHVFMAVEAAQLSKEKIPALERAADDYLLSLYLPYKRVMDKNERLMGYLLMRQREAAAVKLIMAGKRGGFPAEAIRERLRELYG